MSADKAVSAAASVQRLAAGMSAKDAGLTPLERRSKIYWAVREAVRQRAYELAQEWVAERNRQMIPAAFDLLERMLPTEVIQLPRDRAG